MAAPGAAAVVVKSVRAELAAEWIVDRFSPRVLVVERNPLNVLASWIDLDYVRDPREAAAYAAVARARWGIDAPPASAPRLEQQAFTYGVLATSLREAAARHPEWTRVSHDDLCLDAAAGFARVSPVRSGSTGARPAPASSPSPTPQGRATARSDAPPTNPIGGGTAWTPSRSRRSAPPSPASRARARRSASDRDRGLVTAPGCRRVRPVSSPRMSPSSKLLIVGVPRSGTTWTGRVLGRTEGAVYVNEPDGFRDPFAFRVMLGRGENPIVDAGDRAHDYERLWRGALAGGRPTGSPRDRLARLVYDRTPLDARRAARAGAGIPARLRLAAAAAVPRGPEPSAGPVVVKSVQSILALDWLWERFRPRVLVVERNPFNVLASWIELGYVRNVRERDAVAGFAARRWGVEPPGPDSPQLVHQAFTYATLATELREAAARHPEWAVARHEELCVDPAASFRALAEGVGLRWGAEAAGFLAESDADGTPYRTLRRTAEQPERWRERLDGAQVATIRSVLARFPGALVPDA